MTITPPVLCLWWLIKKWGFYSDIMSRIFFWGEGGREASVYCRTIPSGSDCAATTTSLTAAAAASARPPSNAANQAGSMAWYSFLSRALWWWHTAAHCTALLTEAVLRLFWGYSAAASAFRKSFLVLLVVKWRRLSCVLITRSSYLSLANIVSAENKNRYSVFC